MSVEVRILGPLIALHQGSAIKLGGLKERALLAFLALRPNAVVPVERLAEDLWDGAPPARALASIQVFVSHLRKAIGPVPGVAIETRSPGYALVIEPEHIDAARFETALETARTAAAAGDHRAVREAARGGLELWRGPALADVAPNHPEATRLNELRLAALELAVEADLELGDHERPIPELERETAQHPLRERLWGQLMRALYRSERQADALAVYRELRTRLADELGIEPGPELQRLEQAILRQDASLAPPVPARRRAEHLPVPLTAFVGRAREREEVEEALARARLVTIVGLGGCGKSRLAMEVARATVRTSEEAWLVRVESVTDSDLVAGHIARSIGVLEQPGASVQQALVRALGARPTLLLLDGCEHVSHGVGAVASWLLAECAELRILATSRVPLGVRGEVVLPLPPLRMRDAVALFDQRVRQANARLSDASADESLRLVSALDGMPLAIELAAAHANVLTVRQIADRLVSRGEGEPGDAVRSALAWSYDRLSSPEQQLLRRLGIFAGSFALGDAEAVCAGDGVYVSDVLPLIGRLASLALLGTEARDGYMRYSLLDSVRRFARERLREAGEEEAALDRHAEHYERKVRETAPVQLDGDYDDMQAALAWALGSCGDPERALRTVMAPVRLWTMRGRSSEGRLWLSRAIAQTPLPPAHPIVMAVRLAHAAMTMEQGDLVEARVLLESVLPLAREIGDKSAVARATLNLGIILHLLGEAEAATRLQNESLATARDIGDDAVAVRALNNLGLSARRRGDLAEARRLYTEAAELARRSDDVPTAVSALMNLCNVLRSEGRSGEARVACDEALAVSRSAGFAKGTAVGVATLGSLALDEGLIDVAEAAFKEALGLLEDSGEKLFIAATVGNLAAVAELRGDHERAETLAREYLRLSEEIGDARGIAHGLSVAATALVARREVSAAAPLLRRALEMRTEMGDRALVADSLDDVALWNDAAGNHAEAGRVLAASEAIRAAVGTSRDPVRERSIGPALRRIQMAESVDPERELRNVLERLAAYTDGLRVEASSA